MKTAKFAIATAVTALTLMGASEATAQSCIGMPIANGQRALSFGVGFPEGGSSYQARLDVNTLGPVAAHVGYTRSEFDGVAGANNTVAAGAAYQIAAQLPVSVCPAAQVGYSFTTGTPSEATRLDVPLGIGLGTRLEMGAGMSLVPYVMPQVTFSRISTPAGNETLNSSQTAYGATVGAAVDFGPFYTGVDLSTTRIVDVPGTNQQVGLRLGVKF